VAYAGDDVLLTQPSVDLRGHPHGALGSVPSTRRVRRWPRTLARVLARGSVLAILGAVAHGGLGCRRERPTIAAADASAIVVTAKVEFAGCASITRDGTCELGPERTLDLWVEWPNRDADARAIVRVDGRPATPVRVREHTTGTTLRVRVGSPATRMTVEAPAGHPVRDVALRDRPRSSPLLDDVRKLRADGALDAAAAKLSNADATIDPALRGRALGTLARIELARGRREEAIGLFRASMAEHMRLGEPFDRADDAFALAYALLQERRFEEARTVIEDAATMGDAYPYGRARVLRYRGLLALETGDYRSAIELLRRAETDTTHLGLDRMRAMTRQDLAIALTAVGHDAAALDTLLAVRDELPSDAPPCDVTDVLINLGWAAYLARERGEDASAFKEARAAGALAESHARDACREPDRIESAAIGVALLALQEGDLARARDRLRAARRTARDAKTTTVNALFWLDVEGRIQLASGDARAAQRTFEREATLAAASLHGDAEWRGMLGRGRALSALGRDDEAERAYEAAEALLDRQRVHVGVERDTASFLRGREASARAIVELGVKRGHIEQAMRAARRARSRVLATLQRIARVAELDANARRLWGDAIGEYLRVRGELEREAEGDWKLPGDSIARLERVRRAREEAARAALERTVTEVLGSAADDRDAGVLVPRATSSPHGTALEVVIHPGETRWYVLARSSNGESIASPFTPPADASNAGAWAPALLGPIDRLVAAARRIVVFPYGASRNVDVAALPFRGEPLFNHASVAYALDLPRSSTPAGAEAAPPHLLVASDPIGDLPNARREGALVAEAWHAPTRRTVLRGDEVTRDALLDALPAASHLHFAGHGIFDGESGWQSALRVARGGRLTATDILSRRRVPRTVVLSACESARTGAESPVETFGLAQAFVVAGADEVLAATRPVDDRLSFDLARAIYDELRERPETTLESALAHAQRALLPRASPDALGAYRVLIP
jgi:tetratricopeptide (TPR) repeat protein